nr:hypothetical protein GCM10020185_64180 [Pseudomonas brassicacearum subsp. brassicacearum]
MAPDPQYPPMLGNDIFFNGDGMVSRFNFANGKVSMRRRYVKTDRLLAQRREGRSLNGVYRNVYTNDPLAAKKTTPPPTPPSSPHNGVLLALKEDALPWAMDLETLETLGEWSFDGQIKAATFTAHPKLDPVTGNLLACSYEAKGDGTPDLAYFEISPDGKLLHEIWFQAPYAAMVHDFAVTERYVVFPLIPLTVDVDRMKKTAGRISSGNPTCPSCSPSCRATGVGKMCVGSRGPRTVSRGIRSMRSMRTTRCMWTCRSPAGISSTSSPRPTATYHRLKPWPPA